MPRIKVTMAGDEAQAWMEDPIRKLQESENEAAIVETEHLPPVARRGFDIIPLVTGRFDDVGQRAPADLPEPETEADRLVDLLDLHRIEAPENLGELLQDFGKDIERDLRRVDEKQTEALEDFRSEFEAEMSQLEEQVPIQTGPEGVALRPDLACHLYYYGPDEARITATPVYLNGLLIASLAQWTQTVNQNMHVFLRYTYATETAEIDWSGALPTTNYEEYIYRLAYIEWDTDHIDTAEVAVYHEGMIELDLDIPDSEFTGPLLDSRSLEETGPYHKRRIYDFLNATGITGPLTTDLLGSGPGKILLIVRGWSSPGTAPDIPTVKYAVIGTGPRRYVTDVWVTGPASGPSIKMTKEDAWVIAWTGPYTSTILTAAPCPTGP